MKENLDRIGERITKTSGNSRLVLVQSQRLLASLYKLAEDIDAASQPKIQQIRKNSNT